MLPRTYEGQNCSIARALEAVGDRWSLLIVRDAVFGTTRFSEFAESLGVARNVLSARLARLCEEGLLERRVYQERPRREEYLLTEKGRDLAPVLVALLRWGDRYAAPAGPPRVLVHEPCGHDLEPSAVCSACGEPVGVGEVGSRPGPGARV